MRPLCIFGAGIRAELAVDLIAWQLADRYVVRGYYDDRLATTDSGPRGLPILGTVRQGCQDVATQHARQTDREPHASRRNVRTNETRQKLEELEA